MFSQPVFSRRFGITRTLGLAVLLILILLVTPASAEPQVTISNVRISNVRDGSFVVSWVTDVASDGHVDWGTQLPPANVASDTVVNSTTHYVTISGLGFNTAYYFRVRSGAAIDDNGGNYYSVTTGAVLALPTPGRTVFSQVLLPDLVTPAANAIVYLYIANGDASGTPGQSQLLTARSEANGFWFLDLNGTRTTNASAYFAFSDGTDFLDVSARGGLFLVGGLGITQFDVPVPTSYPAQLPNIPLAVALADFQATGQENGVLVSWLTTSEINNQGFNLYRATEPAGSQTLLAFVPSQAPGSGQGASYEWLDTNVVTGGTYYYWLEAVSLSGATTLFGPVSVTYQAPTAVDVTAFTAQAVDSSTLTPWLLILPALLGGAAYGLRRRSRRPAA